MILPDGNLLIAFTWDGHIHYPIAAKFFRHYGRIVTCPLTELNLLRVWMQKGATAAEADNALKDFVTNFRSRMIPCDLSAVHIAGLGTGHRQTTDSYLAMLAQSHGLKIATMDQPFAERFPAIVEWIH